MGKETSGDHQRQKDPSSGLRMYISMLVATHNGSYWWLFGDYFSLDQSGGLEYNNSFKGCCRLGCQYPSVRPTQGSGHNNSVAVLPSHWHHCFVWMHLMTSACQQSLFYMFSYFLPLPFLFLNTYCISNTVRCFETQDLFYFRCKLIFYEWRWWWSSANP